MLMVIVLLFGSKSHVTWLELKTFGLNVQAKKHKKLTLFPWHGMAGLDFAGQIYQHRSMALFTIQSDFRYEIVRKIFEGGMGIVYEAEQHGARDFVKRVAIKIIRPNFASQKMFIENFIGEAKLVADLIHTNIVQTYHLGEANGVCFICHGIDPRRESGAIHPSACGKKNAALPKELAVFITSRIARGLAYAHAKTDKDGKPLGIVHRDVSFKNIMIAFEGDVKLTDFGIAKARGFLTDQEGEVVAGKADYMSPEQADFQVTDKRSDLFSVGVVLRTCCLGKIFSRARPPRNRATAS
jgi:serine/threonine protein kinase